MNCCHLYIWIYNPSLCVFYRCHCGFVIGLRSNWRFPYVFTAWCVKLFTQHTHRFYSVLLLFLSTVKQKQKQFNNFETQFIFFMGTISKMTPVLIKSHLHFLFHSHRFVSYDYISKFREYFFSFFLSVWFGIQYMCDMQVCVSFMFIELRITVDTIY